MRLTVVGCSGSFPGVDSPASCYLVQAGDISVVLDLGSGALGTLQRHLDLRRLDAVLLSHLHPDHCIDVLALYIARTYDPRRHYRPMPVYLPTGGAAHLARAYGTAEHPGLGGTFEFVEWDADFPRRIGPLTVTVARVAHPVQAWGMRIEHEGRALVFSGDTGPCDALVDLAQGADLALFESSFEVDRDLSAPADLHMTGRDAGEAAARAGVRRLVLTHLPPWNDPAVALRDASAVFDGPIELAVSGATYDL
jgi:ribonuclease BN (tRNA processing enzyme)